MSSARIKRQMTQWVQQRGWSEAVCEQWFRAQRAALDGPIELLSLQGYGAHPQAPDVARHRAAVCMWLFTLANLIDDIQDGDCDYVDELMAPCVQALGWSVFSQQLVAAELGQARHARIWRLVERACLGQLDEVSGGAWDIERYRHVTQRISGDQWAIYCMVLWQGTRWEQGAEMVGRCVGSLTSVLLDRRDFDDRQMSMPQADLDELKVWVEQLREELQGYLKYPGMRQTLAWLRTEGSAFGF